MTNQVIILSELFTSNVLWKTDSIQPSNDQKILHQLFALQLHYISAVKKLIELDFYFHSVRGLLGWFVLISIFARARPGPILTSTSSLLLIQRIREGDSINVLRNFCFSPSIFQF